MALKRTLSRTLVAFYGLGTILGAGIYALIGEVAKEAEKATPWAFLIASILALFTAASYAELCARFPYSAGSALYVRRAFNIKWIAGVVGWLVVCTGIVSSAAIAHGFAKYIALFSTFSPYFVITLLVIFLGGLAIWGIKESATLIFIMTLIEVGGLILIIFYGHKAFFHVNELELNTGFSFNGILIGAFIAFYAYIGFEDMVNIAEETINPGRALPAAIFFAVTVATVLYILVAWVVVDTLSVSILAGSDVPLVQIIKSQGQNPVAFIFIALVAISNGILAQIIMASRMIYGMAKQENAPLFFSQVNSKTQTPLWATLFVIGVILLFAYTLPIATLAKITSSVMFLIFLLIHAALIRVKIIHKGEKPAFSVPLFIPILSMLVTVLFIGAQIFVALN
ncbi:amino acid transporter (plasmid) [Legionella adelaidensis]|uniref:Amino acid transporter n=1 Tax=Legionella adelaidensis TaxID=45056 RepID=A0A0W0R2M5_9GAMM|nr:amino acid permease [Legionella adelaidensis]KTC65314.1 amino acid transporter [Legionella adelaidensis]VEH86035.1 amino acid transporter [Legionella adelaidensis]